MSQSEAGITSGGTIGSTNVKPDVKKNKKRVLKKPPISRQSDRFKDLEVAFLEIIGDKYWSWLERKMEEEIVNNAIGYKK